MKKLLLFLIASMLLTGCAAGDIRTAKILPAESTVYTQTEIQDAAKAAMHYFRAEFDGCTLTEITYAGDAESQDYQAWAERFGAQDVLVLTSTFTVDDTGGDGSLAPNSTYRNWKWIMVRAPGGTWQHADHGY